MQAICHTQLIKKAIRIVISRPKTSKQFRGPASWRFLIHEGNGFGCNAVSVRPMHLSKCIWVGYDYVSLTGEAGLLFDMVIETIGVG